MAAPDNSVAAEGSGVTSLTSGSFTIAADTILAVLILDRAQGAITTVTGAGQACSLVVTVMNNRRVSIYKTLTPSAGSQTVSLTGDAGYGDNSQIFIVGLSVEDASDFDDENSATGNSDAATVTVANVGTDDLVIDGVVGVTANIGANQTELHSYSGGAPFRTSTQAGADGGVMSWAQPGDGGAWAIAAMRAVHEDAGGGGVTVKTLAALGVG